MTAMEKHLPLLDRYRASRNGFDEMLGSDGKVREHCAPFLEAISNLHPSVLQQRQDAARMMMKEHGVTYHVFNEGHPDSRPWRLDLLPLIISAREWDQLAEGLIQRTRLLNLVLADLYGKRELIRQGLLPPALVHANTGYLHACHGIVPACGNYLTLHAIELARASDGRWWVMADRTQAPSGVGYTLENRSILSRVHQAEFHANGVRPLSQFFMHRRGGLRSMAPWTSDPNIVLLTPGPLTETYFEHAFLARNLGIPLVQGGDLTVRRRMVYLKTLEGLQRVDVIVRRLDDVYCDPLELRHDSYLGVPGLVEAARAGNVSISNTLGSGAVEAPAILAFLPSLSRHLLGEELKIPNVATWWCGQEKERDYALANLHKLVMKRGFVGGAGEPVFGETATADQKQALIARIMAKPHSWVGQERVSLSTAPVLLDSRLDCRPLLLRAFVCSTPTGFAVMPGGLTRVSASSASPIVTSQHGGGSKDTWVLSTESVEELDAAAENAVDGAPEAKPLQAKAVRARLAARIPSRVVENLFWLGRYAERLEQGARFLRVLIGRLQGEHGKKALLQLQSLGRWLPRGGSLSPVPDKRLAPHEIEALLPDLIYTESRIGSLRELLSRLKELTATVRDRLSGDTWRALNQMQMDFPQQPSQSLAVTQNALHRLVLHLGSLNGMIMENMTRGYSWCLLDLGRRLERSLYVISALDTSLHLDEAGRFIFDPLLELTDSTMTYRRRYSEVYSWDAIIELLVTDETNPRALSYQMQTIASHMGRLPGLEVNAPEMQLVRLLQDEIAALPGLPPDHTKTRVSLGQLHIHFSTLAEQISARYFSHAIARIH